MSTTLRLCEGCDDEQEDVRHFVVRIVGKTEPEIAEYCAGCAALARANWNGETASVSGPFESLGHAEAEIGRTTWLRQRIAVAMAAAMDGDYPAMRSALFSALSFDSFKAREVIEEIGAQGYATAPADGGEVAHGLDSDATAIRVHGSGWAFGGLAS